MTTKREIIVKDMPIKDISIDELVSINNSISRAIELSMSLKNIDLSKI